MADPPAGVGPGALDTDKLAAFVQTSPPSTTEVIVIERESFTANQAFVFKQPGTAMPIDGPGTLVEAVLVAESEAFSVTVTNDGRQVIDNDYATLKGRAGELERISAYERASDGNFVFIVSGYEFQRHIEVVIEPDDSLEVVLQRAEVDVVRGD